MKLQTLDDTDLLEKLKKSFHDCEYIGSCSDKETIDFSYFSYLLGSTAVRRLMLAYRVGVFNFLSKVFRLSLIVLVVLTLVSITSLYFDDWMMELRAVGAGYYYVAAFASVILISVLSCFFRRYLWNECMSQGMYSVGHLTNDRSYVELRFWCNKAIRPNKEECLLIRVNVYDQYSFFVKFS